MSAGGARGWAACVAFEARYSRTAAIHFMGAVVEAQIVSDQAALTRRLFRCGGVAALAIVHRRRATECCLRCVTPCALAVACGGGLACARINVCGGVAIHTAHMESHRLLDGGRIEVAGVREGRCQGAAPRRARVGRKRRSAGASRIDAVMTNPAKRSRRSHKLGLVTLAAITRRMIIGARLRRNPGQH